MTNDWDPQKKRQLKMGLCDALGISKRELDEKMLNLFIQEHLKKSEDPEKTMKEIEQAGAARIKRTTILRNWPKIFDQTHQEMKAGINEMSMDKVLEFRELMREYLTREKDDQTSSRARVKIYKKATKLASARIADIVMDGLI